MFYKKEGLPRESEIVVCTVERIQYHSVFVTLNHYNNKSAMLHISEVSPGRIRNLRDFVKEGKVIVCKVLRIDSRQGHIDVSLRRVNENQRREVVELMKQEQKCENIIEFVAKELKQDPKKLYDKIFKVVLKNYSYLHQAFTDVITGDYDVSSFKLPSDVSELLLKTIQQRIKPPVVEIKSKLHIECYEPGGVNVVKDMLKSFVNLDKEKVNIHYLGGGSYQIILNDEVYDEIQQYYNSIEDMLSAKASKNFIYTLEKV